MVLSILVCPNKNWTMSRLLILLRKQACRVLPTAPATFRKHANISRNPDLASERAKQGFERIEAVYYQKRGRDGATSSASNSTRTIRHCQMDSGTVPWLLST